MSEPREYEDDQQVCEEFVYLLDRGSQLFGGLRDLPDFYNWESYFQRTFEVYTRLWKFQQQHRAILEKKELYGLQRWEIGNVANRIGLLYFSYYLRTSDTNYLEESFLFYEAIRSRQYFKGIVKLKNISLLVKELRFYARFIVVCLLLEKAKLARELAGEVTNLISEYVKYMKANDTHEWQLVVQEMTLFLQADFPLHIKDATDTPLAKRRQVPSLAVKPQRTSDLSPVSAPTLRLQSAILIGNRQHQVKFSELTLDMFRMILALEREHRAAPKGSDKRQPNPRKFLLYRPTISTVLQYLSSSQKEQREDGVMMIYISADPEKPSVPSVGGKTAAPYSRGGVKLKHENPRGESGQEPAGLHVSKDGLYPEDFSPYLRRPLFIVVDSESAPSFLSISGSTFGAPVVVLASPPRHPSGLLEPSQSGSLFTWFLHEPLSAFCFTVSKAVLTAQTYEKCQATLNAMFEALGVTLLSSTDIPHTVALFVHDDFLRMFIARFVFCYAIMHMHIGLAAESSSQFLPRSHPKLPESLLNHSIVTSTVLELAKVLGVSHLFSQPAQASAKPVEK